MQQSLTGRNAILIAVLSLNAPGPARAQQTSLPREGTMVVDLPARRNVCGDGKDLVATRREDGSLAVHETAVAGDTRSEFSHPTQQTLSARCVAGPLHVTITMERGAAIAARTTVGGSAAPSTIISGVPAMRALQLAITSATAVDVAGRLMLPLTLAEGVNPWPVLAQLARGDRAPARLAAFQWLAVSAANRLLDEERGEREDAKSSIYKLVKASREADNKAALERLRAIAAGRGRVSPAERRYALLSLARAEDAAAIPIFLEMLGSDAR